MKIELNIPTSIAEIPLNAYQKFVNVSQNSDDEDFLMEQMVQCFTGLELKSIAKMRMTDLTELIISLTKTLEAEGTFQQRFKIKDLEFGFIPNLEEISFGEYVDLEKYLQDVSTFHKAMAVMYRPIKETFKDRYSIHDYNGSDEYSDLMKFAPLQIVKGANVFFWTLEKDLLQATLTFLETEMNQEIKTHLVKELNLESNGGGMEAYMYSLKETLQDSMQSPSWDFASALLFSRLRNKAMNYSNENLNA
jgi:hypothetical protein